MRIALLFSCFFIFAGELRAENCGAVHLRWPEIRAEIQNYRRLGFKVKANLNKLEIERRKDNHILFAEGMMVGHGVLSLGFYTRSSVAPERVPGFSGRQLFDLMMNYFKHEIEVIKGEWINGGDNIETFSKLVASGMSYENAALGTWTGQQAKRHGFTEVEILEVSQVENDFLKVVVIFFRKE